MSIDRDALREAMMVFRAFEAASAPLSPREAPDVLADIYEAVVANGGAAPKELIARLLGGERSG